MTSLAAPVLHYCLPGHELARAVPIVGERIGEFLARSGWATRRKIKGRWRYCFRLPTVCLINGEYVLQRQWRRRRITSSDHVAFLSRPLGGSGGSGNTKAVLGIVALIAVAAFAWWAGPLIAGALGFGATGLGAGFFTNAIILGGSLLINALVTPKAGGANEDSAEVPQVYSLTAGGNVARVLETIPCRYGRLKRFADFATAPWSEYYGDEQYLHILLSEGVGKFQRHKIYIDDSELWDSTAGINPAFDAQIEFKNPNETVTLFPADVVTATEVAGQQLPSGTFICGFGSGVGGGSAATPGAWVGPFVVNNAGTLADRLAGDFVFPGGIFRQTTDGKIQQHAVTVELEARQVDNAGVPIGSFFQLTFQNFVMNERKPKRVTLKATVGAGRYEIRARRWGQELPALSLEGSDAVIWVAARGYLVGDNAFPVSTTAIRIRATELTQGSARKFGILSTRILPVWTGAAFVEQPTRNPAWAFLDMATNTEYGAKRSFSKLDFNSINNLAIGCNTRGDLFDYDFMTGLPAPEVFDTILKVARARHNWSGDILSVVRDELKTVPQMLLTDREIARGSLAVGYAFQTEDTADCVIHEYLDETLWSPADVQWPAAVVPTNPARIRIDGVVTREKAQEHAAFYWRQNIYRRTTATLDTEWDGKMLAFGSYVRVQSELPQSWGAGGRITARPGTLILTLDPPPTWPIGQNFIEIRTARGKRWGPVKCAKGANDAQCLLDAIDLAAVEAAQGTLASAIARMSGAEDASFALGLASARAMDMIVLRGQPTGERVALNLVLDDPRVHDDDIPDPDDLPPGSALKNPSAPIIAGLTANFDQGQTEPTLRASWFPAAGAVYYIAQVSYDDGASWGQIYEGTQPMFSSVVDYAALDLRVQGIGDRAGAWTQVHVEAPTIIANIQITLAQFEAGLADYVTNEFGRVGRDLAFLQQMIAANSAEQDAQNWLEKRSTTRELSIVDEEIAAAVTETMTVATSAQAASAALTTEVRAKINPAGTGALEVSVTENSTAIATINGELVGTWSVTVDAANHISGIALYGTPSTSIFEIIVDVFRVAFPTGDARAPEPVFQIANVAGVAKTSLRGDVYADGSITATRITAGTIDTVQLAVNGVQLDDLLAGAATNVAWTQIGGSGTISAGIGYTNHGSVAQTNTSGIVLVTLEVDFIRAITAGGLQTIQVAIFVDGGNVYTWNIVGTAQGIPLSMRRVVAVSTGARTYSIRTQGTTSGGGTYSFNSGAINVEELRK
jgi:hypothetical protein